MPVPLRICFSDLVLAGVPLPTAWKLARGRQMVTPYGESCLRWHVKSAARWWWKLLPKF